MATKVETKYGDYVNGKVCLACDWTQQPEITVRHVCPLCGDYTSTVVGRWMYKRKRIWLFCGDWRLIKFIPGRTA